MVNSIQEWESFPLDEAAKEIGISEKSLLRKAAFGKLPVYVWCDNPPLLCLDREYKGWFQIPSEYIPDLVNGLMVSVDRMLTEDGVEVFPAEYYFENVVYRSEFMGCIPGSKKPEPHMEAELVGWAVPVYRNDIRIFPNDLEKLQASDSSKQPDSSNKSSEDDGWLFGWKDILEYVNELLPGKKTWSLSTLKKKEDKPPSRWLIKGENSGVRANKNAIYGWMKRRKHI